MSPSTLFIHGLCVVRYLHIFCSRAPRAELSRALCGPSSRGSCGQFVPIFSCSFARMPRRILVGRHFQIILKKAHPRPDNRARGPTSKACLVPCYLVAEFLWWLRDVGPPRPSSGRRPNSRLDLDALPEEPVPTRIVKSAQSAAGPADGHPSATC